MSSILNEEIKLRNQILVGAFENMKICVRRIQYWLEDEWLRVFVLSDFNKDERAKYILEQVGTSFCIISLGTCETGEYSIVLSIDSRINEKIGYDFSSILLRRLYEFTPEECAYNVRVVNFSKDCDENLRMMFEEEEFGTGFHDISVTPFEG